MRRSARITGFVAAKAAMVAVGLAVVAVHQFLQGQRAVAAEPALETARSAHDFTFQSIDGGPLALSSFEGRPVLLVNTASRCGFTHQYAGLQTLWETYRDDGLVVLGAPSQDFNQEYGSADEIKEFCEVNFGLDFPMTDLVHVKGADAHPFYAWAATVKGAPRWNFYKYLIDKNGEIVGFYPSSTGPESRRLVADIEATLSN